VVPQFTLYADASKGNRPGFSQAAPPAAAEPLYEEFVRRLKDISGLTIESGSFGAAMEVELLNDGPVTIFIEK
jgi:D-tyrosyl-tRNA(Tyr) deacylase